MKNHKNWRIISILIVFSLLGIIINGLVNNSEKRISEIYLADYSNGLAKGISEFYQSNPTLDSQEDLSKLRVIFQKNLSNLKAMGIIEGRKFIFHSDSELIGAKIDKDLFDTQRELKKNKLNPENPYIIWRQTELNSNNFRIYYPLYLKENITGMAYLETSILTDFHVNINSFLIYLMLGLGAIMVLLIDKYIKRFAFLPGAVIFVLLIVLVVNIIGNDFDKNLDQWEKYRFSSYEKLTEEAQLSGVDTEFSSLKMVLPFAGTLEIWKYTLSLLGILFLVFILTGAMESFFSTLIEYKIAYLYILPAMFGVFLLVFFPFIYGFLIGFTDYNLTNFGGDLVEYFTNLNNYNMGNFYNILKVINFKEYSNFYFTLAHTIIWTIMNLVFHVSIGVGLALLLNDPKLKFRTTFRILLILPWAIPNYITALIWRGMFHKQFGAVNGLLELLGFEPISWFTQPVTAFLANFATNVWLGFPFMMIIALGALQSIPKELYEASAIDGSSKWQSFWNVTMPLLRPAMVPAIILGTIWTFNQFNVIYLVSGGGPDGATELLITDAYKLAFEQYRYGYAAAYCIVIFIVLLSYGLITSKVTKATKGVYE